MASYPPPQPWDFKFIGSQSRLELESQGKGNELKTLPQPYQTYPTPPQSYQMYTYQTPPPMNTTGMPVYPQQMCGHCYSSKAEILQIYLYPCGQTHYAHPTCYTNQKNIPIASPSCTICKRPSSVLLSYTQPNSINPSYTIPSYTQPPVPYPQQMHSSPQAPIQVITTTTPTPTSQRMPLKRAKVISLACALLSVAGLSLFSYFVSKQMST